MIQYNGITFSSVDELIEYQNKIGGNTETMPETETNDNKKEIHGNKTNR